MHLFILRYGIKSILMGDMKLYYYLPFIEKLTYKCKCFLFENIWRIEFRKIDFIVLESCFSICRRKL